MPSLSHGAIELAIGAAAAALACAAALAVARRSGSHAPLASVVAVTLATLLAAIAVVHVPRVASVLRQARRDRVSARAGLEHCVTESLNGAPVGRSAPGFLFWVRTQLPAGARYAVAPHDSTPDGWCLTTVLLPALPASADRPAGWTLAVGAVPPEMQARIDRGDPSVRVYAPGYALEREASP